MECAQGAGEVAGEPAHALDTLNKTHESDTATEPLLPAGPTLVNELVFAEEDCKSVPEIPSGYPIARNTCHFVTCATVSRIFHPNGWLGGVESALSLHTHCRSCSLSRARAPPPLIAASVLTKATWRDV